MAMLPMRYFQFKVSVAILAVAVSAVLVAAQTQTQTKPKTQASPFSGIGSLPTQEEIGNLAWSAGPAGRGLPPGTGTGKQGALIFKARCAMCHGQNAEGVHWDPGVFSPLHGPRLGGGNGVPTYIRPPGRIVTLAYSAPTSMVIFNTIAVEMPMFRPGTLTPDQVYSLTAFVLLKNGIVKEDEVMNRETLPKVQMPNRNALPASDDVYMDMKKRDCYKTYGVCLAD